LREKGYAPREAKGGLKILSNGELTKKVTIEAHAFSEKAKQKLDDQGIKYTQIV
jgi:large subunit ribosomal protein L15